MMEGILTGATARQVCAENDASERSEASHAPAFAKASARPP
jgi:hypothetical protein